MLELLSPPAALQSARGRRTDDLCGRAASAGKPRCACGRAASAWKPHPAWNALPKRPLRIFVLKKTPGKSTALIMEVRRAYRTRNCDHVCGMYAHSYHLFGCVCRSHAAVPVWLDCLRAVGRPDCFAPSQGIMGGQDLQALRYEAAKNAGVARAVVCTYGGPSLTVRVCRSNMLSDGEKREEERLEQERAAKMGPVSVRFSRCAQRPPHTRAHLCFAQWCLLPIVHSRWPSPRPLVSSHSLAPAVRVFGTLPIPSRAR